MMGPAAAPAGVMFREEPFTPSGERVAHDLVMRYGALDCVNDNAHHLEDADLPVDNSIVSFISHRIYIAVVANKYPADVLNYDKLPPSSDDDLSRIGKSTHHRQIMNTLQHPIAGIPHACTTRRAP
ncbi:hypothetical protein D1007_56186 [Hordeum vulgare]|nr:hypothetical protein D1007_56186 [Hordeum vulgare]